MADARAWLTRSLTGLLCCEANEIHDDARLVEDLGADSLDFVELQVAIEDGFSVKIDDEEIAPVATVRQLLALIDRKVAAA